MGGGLRETCKVGACSDEGHGARTKMFHWQGRRGLSVAVVEVVSECQSAVSPKHGNVQVPQIQVSPEPRMWFELHVSEDLAIGSVGVAVVVQSGTMLPDCICLVTATKSSLPSPSPPYLLLFICIVNPVATSELSGPAEVFVSASNA